MSALQAVHLCSHRYHRYDPDNTELPTRVLLLFVSYLFLLIFVYLFMKKCIRAQTERYDVTPLPSADALGYIYGSVVVVMGAIGLYCAVEDEWTTRAWFLYLASNTLIATLIATYQTNKTYTLVATALIAVALSIFLQLLFIESSEMDSCSQTLVVRNLVGAVSAWSIISTLMILGQWAVYDLQMSYNCQSALFFLFAIIIPILVTMWNRSQDYGTWNKFYGFSVSTEILLFISIIRVCDRQDGI